LVTAIRFSDDLGDDGFSWIVDEPMTRTSHALAAEGKVWPVDPLRLAGGGRPGSVSRPGGRRE
jgi:hypothetical protein